MTQTKSVTFAVDYTTKGGRSYKAGATHTINSPEARILLRLGKVRLAEESAPTTNEPAADAVTGTPAASAAGDGTTTTTAAARKGK